MTTSILGIDDRVEEEGNKVGKVVSVKMGKEDVRDLVPVHTSFDQVHQGAWAEIEQNLLVRTHQLAGRSTRRMHVGSGA